MAEFRLCFYTLDGWPSVGEYGVEDGYGICYEGEMREIVAFPDGRPFWNVEHYRVVTLHAECDAQGKVIWPERAKAMVKGLGDIIWENDSDDWDAQAIPASSLWDELFSNDPQERHGRM